MAINIISRQITLDVYRHDKASVTVNAIAADNDTRYVAAEIQNDGVRYDISSSATVELMVLRPDKVGVSIVGQPQELTYETDPVFDPDTGETTPGETVTYYGVYAELDQAALAKSGTLLGQFKIASGNQVLRTELFKINNGRALDAETSDWSGDYQGYNLDELVERIEALEQGGGSSFSSDIKAALLAAFRGLVWREDVDSSALYSALDTAFNPPVNLASITAVYTQSGAVDIYDSLESLRSDLVVTAHYTDNTSAVVTSYTLSGTLTIGTSTITVIYGGKTTTFNVTVTSEWDYIWDLTRSLTDTVGGVTAVASAGTGVDAPAITSAGLVFNAATQRLSLGDINLTGKTIEIDVESLDFKGNTDYHMRFLLNGSNSGPLLYKASGGWQGYGLAAGSTSNAAGWKSFTWIGTSQRLNRSLINGVTVKLVNETDNTITLYIDGTAVATMTTLRYGDGTQDLAIGGAIGYSQSAGDQCYDMIISGVRIKTNPVTTGGEE